MSFANHLKILREANHVTQQELADYLNVSRTTVGGYETKSKEPNYEILERIAQYFNVSIDYLISGHEFSDKTNGDFSILYSKIHNINGKEKRDDITRLVEYSSRMEDQDLNQLMHYAELLLLQTKYKKK